MLKFSPGVRGKFWSWWDCAIITFYIEQVGYRCVARTVASSKTEPIDDMRASTLTQTITRE
jgi:hypothetical protein